MTSIIADEFFIKMHLENLTIGYRTKKKEFVVANHLTADLQGGQLTCLLGPNGVGKSTLIRTLSGFQPPLHGCATLHGTPMQYFDRRQWAQTVSVVLTDKIEVQNLTVRQVIELGRTPYTDFWGTLAPDDTQAVEQAIEWVGIASLVTRPVHTLSDGERQKVMIAKALAQHTPVVILDEPIAFLDFPSKVEILRLLRWLSVATGKIVLLSTHDIDLALQLADNLWLMYPLTASDSSVRPCTRMLVGTPSELSANGSINAVFDTPALHYDPLHRSFTVTSF